LPKTTSIYAEFIICFLLRRGYFQKVTYPPPHSTPALDKITASNKTVFNQLNNSDRLLRSDYYSANMRLSGREQDAPLGQIIITGGFKTADRSVLANALTK